MWKLCKYKNALGVPGKGLHSYRLFNIPIFDVLFTILGARILQIFIFPENHYLSILVLLFLTGIILHKMFCVQTPIQKISIWIISVFFFF